MPYSECPTSYGSVFCSRCPTWNNIYTRIWAHLHRVRNSSQMWLSVPYSECPTPYSSLFCSRCPTWNSIYIRSWADLSGVEEILLWLEHTEFKANMVYLCLYGAEKILLRLEFKANVVICALHLMP